MRCAVAGLSRAEKPCLPSGWLHAGKLRQVRGLLHEPDDICAAVRILCSHLPALHSLLGSRAVQPTIQWAAWLPCMLLITAHDCSDESTLQNSVESKEGVGLHFLVLESCKSLPLAENCLTCSIDVRFMRPLHALCCRAHVRN